MRKLLFALLFLLLGGFLATTNPDDDAFAEWIRERVEARLQDETGDGTLGRILTDMGASVVSGIASRAAERENWLLFSVYTIDLGADGRPDDEWRVLGLGGRFWQIATPEAVR